MSVHSISNSKISVSVNSIGAELVSLKSGSQELLWQSDKSIWPRYAPVLFPIVGKLKDNAFSIGTSRYNLSQHGFARDREFTLIEQSERVLEFELTANEETLEIYPFHFSLRIKYELNENGLNTKYIVFNPDKNSLLFSLGAHPGFSCTRIPGESLSDFYIEFDQKKELIIEKLNNGLLSGQTSILKLDSGRLPLSMDLFKEDALVFKNTQIENVKLCSAKSAHKIIMSCKSWPYFGIWTKKNFDAFVCLEPWYGIADSIDSSADFKIKEGIIQLEPYNFWEAAFNITIVD